MDSISTYHPILLAIHSSSSSKTNLFSRQFNYFSKAPFSNSFTILTPNKFFRCNSTANNPISKSLSPSIVDEVYLDDDFEEFDDDDDAEGLEEDDYSIEDAEPTAGDGGGGGGISLSGTTWDKEALAIAEEVSLSFNGELGIYAFKTLKNSAIRVRIERLSNKSGSPTMEDIEAFSSAYRKRLNEAEDAGLIPDISLEVSSPGLERVVRIPQDLERFKDRPMYVKHATDGDDATGPRDGIFKLVSLDMKTECCTWGLADVRVNREKAGKGRPLNKKQREWRLVTPFESLVLVRIYADL